MANEATVFSVFDGQTKRREHETFAARSPEESAKRTEQEQIVELQRLLEGRIAELTQRAGANMTPAIAAQIQSMRSAVVGGNLAALMLVYNETANASSAIAAEAAAENSAWLNFNYENAYNAPLSREALERIAAVGRDYNIDNVREREDLARLFVNPNAPDAAQAVQGAARDPETIALQREYVSHPAETRRNAEEHTQRSGNGLRAAINAAPEGSEERAILERALKEDHFRSPEVRTKLKEYIRNKDEKALNEAKEMMDARDKHVQAKAQEKGTSVTQEKIGLSIQDSLRTIEELGKSKNLEQLQTYNQIISGKSEVFGKSENLSEQEQLNEVAKLVKRQGMTDAQAQELAKAVLSSSEIKKMQAVDLKQNIDDAMMAGFKAMQKGDSGLSFKLAKDVEELMKESGLSDKDAANWGAFLTEGAKLGVANQSVISTFSEETAKLSIKLTLKEMEDAASQNRAPSMANVTLAFSKEMANDALSSATSAVGNAVTGGVKSVANFLGFGGVEIDVVQVRAVERTGGWDNVVTKDGKKLFDLSGDSKQDVEAIKAALAKAGVDLSNYDKDGNKNLDAKELNAAMEEATVKTGSHREPAPSSTPNQSVAAERGAPIRR